MNPEQLRALLAEALAPVTQRLDALEARSAATTTPTAPAAPAPAAAAPTGDAELRARVAALEASNARQRTVIANLSAQPQRMGSGHRVALAASGSAAFASTEIGGLLKRCEAEGEDHAMALREVVTRHQPLLAVKFRSKGAEGKKLREACDTAEEMLREICVAADADGTLSDWRRLHVL